MTIQTETTFTTFANAAFEENLKGFQTLTCNLEKMQRAVVRAWAPIAPACTLHFTNNICGER